MDDKMYKESKLQMSKNKKQNSKKIWKKYKYIMIIFGVLLVLLITSGVACAVSFLEEINVSKSIDSTKVDVVEEHSQNDDVNDDVNEDEQISSDSLPGTEIMPELMEEEEAVSITISAIGDCTLGTDVNFDESTNFTAVYNEQGYPGYFFEKVKYVLEQDDLTIANLEGTLTDSVYRENKVYAFKGNPSYTAILTEGSVEAVNLANNHSQDYGTDSYTDTIKHLDAAGIVNFGYDRTAVVDVKGIPVGLVGIYEIMKGYDAEADLREGLAQVKNAGAKLIIVSFHWGTEKENYPDDVQKTLAHIAIDEGAHLVLGHHPHVIQGIEEYKGRNIVYSLGNFCFGGNSNPSDKDTMIFKQTFTVQNDYVIEDNVKTIIPCSISSVSSYNNYQPRVFEGEDAQRVLDRIQTYSSGWS